MQTPEPADAAGSCITRALRHLAAARDHARSVQLGALHHAIADELTHPAMAGDDPLMAALQRQLECGATEGAQPASTAGSGLTPQQWQHMAEAHREGGRGWWLVGVALLGVMAWLISIYPMGWEA